ncbi:MAG: VCBS repeat-containing protein [Deltaproteobacteria bacterium]|nr:VCBS repeat-containing protein [Deltaproteobacteria bacterium]
MTRRTRSFVLVAVALAAVLSISLWLGALDSAPETKSAQEVEARVRATCSTCHFFPPPEILPRSWWRNIVEQMVERRKVVQPSFSMDLSVDEIVGWYESRAPENLPIAHTLSRRQPGPLRFSKHLVDLGPESGPAVATVQRLDPGLVPDAQWVLAAANMANGSVHLFAPSRSAQRIGAAEHPARVASGDLDGDGLADLVISDLGNTMPTDDPVGRVLVARNAGDGSFALETVLDEVGRVADARPVDLDGDGDLDIAVAAFGSWFRGGIYILHNQTRASGPLDFRVEKISNRPGAVSLVPVEALDGGSGRGFAVAFAQQYELVSLFYETGGRYEEHVVYRGPHPNWGVSNLTAMDFDGDADVDFLLAHGDTLDDGLPFKFYHGVEWLENRGNAQFSAHRIGTLYGAHSAEAVDLDGDGDLDVVASGFLPQVNLSESAERMRLDSLVWFERTDGEWIPWSIELNHPLHTGMTVVDFNRDGRPDIVAAINRDWKLEEPLSGPSLEVFINEGPR